MYLRGRRLIGTTAQRNAYAYVVEGLEWWNTTTGALEVYTGGNWVRFNPGPTGTITASSGTTINHQYLSKVPGGLVEIAVRFTRGANIANTQVLGQLPTGFGPANLWVLPATVAPNSAHSSALRIGTDGALSYVGSTAGTSLWVSGRFPLT